MSRRRTEGRSDQCVAPGASGAKVANCATLASGTWTPLATGTSTGCPSNFEGDAGDPGERRGGEDHLRHRLDLQGRADQLAEGPAQIHRCDTSGDVGAQDRGLRGEGTLQTCGGLGVGGAGHQGPEHGGEIESRDRYVATHSHEVTGGADEKDLDGDLDGRRRRRGGGRVGVQKVEGNPAAR